MSVISGSKRRIRFVCFHWMDFSFIPGISSPVRRVFLCWQFFLWLTTESLRAVDFSKVVEPTPQFPGEEMSELFARELFPSSHPRSRLQDKHAKVSSNAPAAPAFCPQIITGLQHLTISAKSQETFLQSKASIVLKIHISHYLLAIFLWDVKFEGRVRANVRYFSRTLVAGRTVGWGGWGGWGGGAIDSILSFSPFILSRVSPSSTTSHFSCCATLSREGIPSYQPKCLRTFICRYGNFYRRSASSFGSKVANSGRTSCSK